MLIFAPHDTAECGGLSVRNHLWHWRLGWILLGLGCRVHECLGASSRWTMKRLLAKFGYIPKSDIEDFRIQLASTLAVNAELRETVNHLQHDLRQVISERERHRLAHDT